MFIRSLTLRNILSFREPEPLELLPLNIFIGANASGKSNLIDCIELLQALPTSVNNYINSRGGTEAWMWKGPKHSGKNARVTCEFRLQQGQPLKYEIEFRAVDRYLTIDKEVLPPFLHRDSDRWRIREDGLQDSVTGSGVSGSESVLMAYRNPADRTPINGTARALSNIRIYRSFRTGTNDDARLGVSTALPKHPLDEKGSNLALVLQDMDFHDSLKRVMQSLSHLSDRFEDIKFSAEGGRLQLYLQERGLGKVSATRLSDGTLKFLCLMAVLFDHDPPPLVCIDEPESGLHPDALRLVAEALRDASKRMQIIVTTHSDALVDWFGDEPETIIVCERGFDESTRFKRLSRNRLKEWLEEYTLGDLWRRGEIGGTQK